MLDAGFPEGQRWYSRAQYLSRLLDAAIETVLQHIEVLPGAFSTAYFEPQDGAIGRVDPRATAFPHRDAAYSFHILAGWTEPGEDAEIMQWMRDSHQAMLPPATSGVYVHLLSEDEKHEVPAAYRANHDRLVQLKKKFDPENLFRNNHNIEPVA
jgi:FAD/FMN-containing dehydrogenase